jgi:hypothetical protein
MGSRVGSGIASGAQAQTGSGYFTLDSCRSGNCSRSATEMEIAQSTFWCETTCSLMFVPDCTFYPGKLALSTPFFFPDFEGRPARTISHTIVPIVHA